MNMIPGCISTYVYVDSNIKKADEVSAPLASSVFYDVIRIKNSVPLFFENHAQRFFNSFVLSGFPYIISRSKLQEAIERFIAHENFTEGNIRIVYYHDAKPSFCIYRIAHVYPSDEQYKQGVSVALMNAVRKDPNIKQELYVRILANETIQQKQVYDVLFVDEQHTIREGSRTNLFFVKGNTLVTARSEDVLCGITRSKVLEICKELDITVLMQKIPVDTISEFDACFLTGTSPKVLPVSQIDSVTYSLENTLMNMLMNAYNETISTYIKNYKS